MKLLKFLESKDHKSIKFLQQTKDNHIIEDLNDSPENALELAELIEPYPFIVKLSSLNDNCGGLKAAKISKFDLFEKILHSHGIETCRFISKGTDIKAGCGQLRRHFYQK